MSFKVIGIGEVLWDILPGGKQLGGASANFAYHAQMLGAEAWLISRVGNDLLGSEILERLCAMQMSADCVELDSSAPTGTVSVELSSDGQPNFSIRENVAWDHIAASEFARGMVARADAVCFGSLAQRHEISRATIRSLVASTRPDALRIFDANLRQSFFSLEVLETSLQLANVLKLNDDELPVLAKFFGLSGGTEEQLSKLARRFDLRMVALTCGARGSLFYSQGTYSGAEALPARVVDTVGAGDSFTAMLAMGLLAGWEIDRINRRANEVAAYVVSQPGAMPKLPAHLCLSQDFSLNAGHSGCISQEI
jgi:fructokinase